MAELLISQRGKVVSIPEASGALGRVKVQGFAPLNTIIESLGINRETNVQFQESLDEAIYVYSFGDKMGQVRVSGTTFSQDCNDPSAGAGPFSIFDYYTRHRASERNDPVFVSLPESLINMNGFLIAMNLNQVDPIFGLWKFELMFRMLAQS
jgi:hypothetical protein